MSYDERKAREWLTQVFDLLFDGSIDWEDSEIIPAKIVENAAALLESARQDQHKATAERCRLSADDELQLDRAEDDSDIRTGQIGAASRIKGRCADVRDAPPPEPESP